jgi:hypothetical protein
VALASAENPPAQRTCSLESLDLWGAADAIADRAGHLEIPDHLPLFQAV